MTAAERIHLSPPHLGGNELALVHDAFASNWIAPLGPHVDGFEREMTGIVGVDHALALSSGTAALHLALIALAIQPGDEVWCSTLTFCGSVNPIAYVRATPVFIDCDERTWNCDPALLAEALDRAAATGRLPKAVIVVDLYGQCADWDPIVASCDRHGVALLEDAAESLGSRYRGRSAGSFGRCAILSFNGNKIITTSGGGMLVSRDAALIARARHLATQARDPAPHYQHSAIGYNYRLSNVLAAIGRGQLATLEDRVATRRRTNDRYRALLADCPGIRFMPEESFGDPSSSRANRWLTVITVDPAQHPADRETIRLALEQTNIEARPVWKPMHLQPVFAGCRAIGGAVSERLFARGLCLPSGHALTDDQIVRIAAIVRDPSRGTT
ncbi:MAG: aminotransferase class I/II-fold pyridoxal phosphate-dependent enzyme [Planctomycetes bacterium]|nr:aminotransferase class I/II-fold pyridoxal phosphate-dependent enzyme [Planctomycetota bacterium]